MKPKNTTSTLGNLVYYLAESIPSDFYKLRYSYKSLRLYEYFLQILTARGYKKNFHTPQEDKEALKKYILERLKITESSAERDDLIEMYYIGIISAVLTHSNINVPSRIKALGATEIE